MLKQQIRVGDLVRFNSIKKMNIGPWKFNLGWVVDFDLVPFMFKVLVLRDAGWMLESWYEENLLWIM